MSIPNDGAPPSKTMLIFGIGKLGGATADILACRHPGVRYVLVSRCKKRSTIRANLARYLAAQWGKFPTVIGEAADLFDQGQTAELLDRYKPDLVFNATTPFPWWKLDHFPSREKALAHEAGPGTWCALDCLCLLYTSPSPRDQRGSRMPSSA